MFHNFRVAQPLVATKLLLSDYPAERVLIVNAFLAEEHEDNQRFMDQCEWFDHPIMRLRDEKFGASAMRVYGSELSSLWAMAGRDVKGSQTRCAQRYRAA